MNEDLFTTFEQMETCHRVEVTIENLHLLAQHFDGMAAYAGDPDAHFAIRDKPQLIIHRGDMKPARAEIGSWIDERGSRWNPEPSTQGWEPEGTWKRAGDGE